MDQKLGVVLGGVTPETDKEEGGGVVDHMKYNS